MNERIGLFPDTEPQLIDLESRSPDLRGLGTLSTKNAALPSADTAPAQGAGYVQADVQAILTELRDLKAKLRAAGILSP